ncbi:MAG: hypothetical protein NC485_08105 [Ruminococcus flavefaciens]|nr:hypothetical protein [Ruminococcus flavefaciens]MCM1060492.1 hypothetical protein [Eubacterium sp.]
MKKVATYLPSLMLSIILVLCFIASITVIIVDINITENSAVALTEKKELASKSMSQIEKGFKEKSGSTGIPASVYTDAIDDEYIKEVIEIYITHTFKLFTAPELGSGYDPIVPNSKLESSIDAFFNEQAEKNSYEKDEVFMKKLEATKNNAYKIIGNNCDVYKLSSLYNHGAMPKISKLYKMRPLLTFASTGAVVLLILFLLAINRKDKKVFLYWTGISAIISGVIGTVPSAYLLATKYFNAFSIKQPQVFAAYTGAMYKITEAFMAASIALIVVGISFIVLYAVFCSKNKITEQKIEVINNSESDK